MDRTGLFSALNDWTERGYSEDQFNEFVELAESDINIRLMGYQREVTEPLITDADGYASLPAAFKGMRSVYSAGMPYRYTISGTQFYVLDGASRTFDVTYYQGLPALTSTNTSNWLLAAAPNAYLFMVQAQSKAFEEEWQTAAGLKAQAIDIIDGLGLQNTLAQYSRTGMVLPVQAP